MPVWFIVRETKLLVLVWQVSHWAVVGMWVRSLPVAVVPSWQVEQRPAVDASWVNLAGFQSSVVWHESQDSLVAMWFFGFPVALLPSWHVVHVPAATPA